MNRMKYYIDDFGNYLGGSDSEVLSTNEVPSAPNDARQLWNGTDYNPVSITDIDAKKDEMAQEVVNSIALTSAIEEFEAVLIAASISVPADIKANVQSRIRSKL